MRRKTALAQASEDAASVHLMLLLQNLHQEMRATCRTARAPAPQKRRARPLLR